MKIKALIVEDEFLTAQKLQTSLKEIAPDIEVIDILDSVEESVQFLKNAPSIDLLFLDIHLADGSCFEIFKQIKVEIPIIFTTAYDQYTLEAFQQLSIDYLLKPIEATALLKSLEKFRKWFQTSSKKRSYDALLALLQQPKVSTQKRFLVQAGKKYLPIQVEDIAYFYADSKLVFLKTKAGRNYIVNFTMEKLSQLIDPQVFFRVNRKILVHIESIKEFQTGKKGKLELKLEPEPDFLVSVPEEKMRLFKAWINQ